MGLSRLAKCSGTWGSRPLDVAEANHRSVRFAGAAVVSSSSTDVDHDGRLDLVLHFRTQATNLRALYEQLLADDSNADGVPDTSRQEAEVSLTGQTLAEHLFEGIDAVNLVLSGKSLRDLLWSLVAAGMI